MKAVILAGGLGTRLQEFTTVIPKPMVEIGNRPILWHIMKGYAHCGVKDFVIALGYKGHVVKQFFMDYSRLNGSARVDLGTGEIKTHEPCKEDWRIDLVDTGEKSQTGCRLANLKSYIGNETFFMTYGDGVSDIDVNALLAFHRKSGRAVTLTAIRPPARFGALKIEDGIVQNFAEKPRDGGGWVSGGFFVCEPSVFDYVTQDDACVFEHEPMERLAREGQLAAFQHHGFWSSMDTVRDVNALNDMWRAGPAPWKTWGA